MQVVGVRRLFGASHFRAKSHHATHLVSGMASSHHVHDALLQLCKRFPANLTHVQLEPPPVIVAVENGLKPARPLQLRHDTLVHVDRNGQNLVSVAVEEERRVRFGGSDK